MGFWASGCTHGGCGDDEWDWGISEAFFLRAQDEVCFLRVARIDEMSVQNSEARFLIFGKKRWRGRLSDVSELAGVLLVFCMYCRLVRRSGEVR